MKLFVWDLHGTLEKGNEGAVVERSHDVLKSMGFNPASFTRELCVSLTGLPWIDYFRKSHPGLSECTYQEFYRRCVAPDVDRWDVVERHIKPNTNSLDVLSRIKGEGHEQIVISVTTHEHLKRYLEILGMADFFSEGRFIGIDETPLTKPSVVSSYIDKNGPFNRVVAIGDSAHDMLGRSNGDVNFLYAHPDGRIFRECNLPNVRRIRDLREVLDEI